MINWENPDFSSHPGRRKSGVSFKGERLASEAQIDVSIITPYYNTGCLFDDTVNSVLGQTFQNWEWLIVDDGSDDKDSIEHLFQLTSGDSRIKVIRQDNAGPSAARNRAFENSRGRYVCILDSDDMIESTYLEKCTWFLDSNPEFSFCNTYSVIFGDQEYLWTQGYERNKDFLKANSGPPISVVRRDAYAASGGFDESIRFGHEDWDFWLAMAAAGCWGYTIPEYLQWYRKRGNGRFEQIMRSGEINDEFEAAMRRKYSGLKKNFPDPQRRAPQPYETIPVEWVANNRLRPNPSGRRIMFIVPWMVIGGADRVNLDLIEGLVARGHEVTVCATLSAEHRWEHKFAELTPDIFVLPNFLRQSDYPRFLAYLIDSRHIDTVVVTGSTMGYQLLPYLRTCAPDTAFVDLSHVEEPHWLNGGHPRFGVGYQDVLDLNVVTTAHLAKWMEGRGADPARIRVLYTGARPPRLERTRDNQKMIRDRFGIGDDLPVIVFAGRICEQKRPALLAEVLKAARDANLRFHALIIGDGPLRPLFESLLDKYDLRRMVQTVGHLPHEQWLETLAGADILLMPSEYEGISIALLEAMAAGVVPVVARVGGQNEIIDENVGYLIPHGDGEIPGYVGALGELIGNLDNRGSKSKACQALMSSRYSWAKTIEEFELIISDAHRAIQDRRCHLTLPLARELASLALENKRLADAWGWSGSLGNLDVKRPQRPLVNLFIVSPMIRVATFLNKTKYGQRLLGNATFRRIGRGVIVRLVNK
jgi:glycosyltransferase involved in cell wall biosynthesis/GT2 family glycosyltransferase